VKRGKQRIAQFGLFFPFSNVSIPSGSQQWSTEKKIGGGKTVASFFLFGPPFSSALCVEMVGRNDGDELRRVGRKLTVREGCRLLFLSFALSKIFFFLFFYFPRRGMM